MITSAISANIRWQQQTVNKGMRGSQRQQKPCVVWLTGLSGSGKSTLANAIEARLFAEGKASYILDGDNLRHGLTADLGFSLDDRTENIRRVGEVAKLFVDAGLIVFCSFISPLKQQRDTVRGLFNTTEFIEVYVNTNLEACEKRDPKGLYAKARRGEIKEFTGIDSVYQAPESAELLIDTESTSIDQAVEQLHDYLTQNAYLQADSA